MHWLLVRRETLCRRPAGVQIKCSKTVVVVVVVLTFAQRFQSSLVAWFCFFGVNAPTGLGLRLVVLGRNRRTGIQFDR